MIKIAILLSFLITQVAVAKTTVIGNVKGYTLTNSGALVQFDYLAIDNGKVVALGDKSILEDFTDTTLINGQGKTLLPGLIDGHGHLLGLGATLLQVDVRDLPSAVESAKKAAEYASEHPDLAWITGRGWNQVLWPSKAFPTAQQLDEQVKERPTVLERVDGHALWVNSKALQLAGITKQTIAPPGGKIVRDEQGNPSGVLIDNAMDLVYEQIPKESDEAYLAQLKAASDHLLSLGVTSMHDAGINHQVYHLYQSQAEKHALQVRIYAMIAATDPELMKMLDTGYVTDPQEFLSIRSVKAYGDGALGSRGAALLADYSDAKGNRGLLVTQENQLKPLFDLVLGKGFQLNFHAIGDRSNRMALDQFADSYSRTKGRQLRNRIEHSQVVSLVDIPRFKQLDVLPAMQPTHATSDMNMAEDRLGKERLLGAYAWKRFLDNGSRLVLGSDFPVELANPFYGLHAAVTRQDRNNNPVEGWLPDQALTLKQAFKGFTIDAAYGAHQESTLGGLTEGKWADFILVDQDIFSVPAEDLWKTKVLQTWVAGKKVYQLQ